MDIPNQVSSILKLSQAKGSPANSMLLVSHSTALMAHLESKPEIPLEVFKRMDNETRAAMLYMFCGLMANAGQK